MMTMVHTGLQAVEKNQKRTDIVSILFKSKSQLLDILFPAPFVASERALPEGIVVAGECAIRLSAHPLTEFVLPVVLRRCACVLTSRGRHWRFALMRKP